MDFKSSLGCDEYNMIRRDAHQTHDYTGVRSHGRGCRQFMNLLLCTGLNWKHDEDWDLD